MTDRACHCGKRLRRDNRSGVCHGCRRRKRSAVLCAGGCRRPLDVRARHGLCRWCTMQLAHRIAVQLADLAESQGNPPARGLFEAAVALARRTYSPTRADAFTSALIAFGAASATSTLLTQGANE